MYDFAELYAIVQARAQSAPCAVCGHTEWRTTTRIVRLPLVSEDDGSTEPYGPEALFFVCKNCANLRLFLVSMLEEIAATSGNGAGA
jgi:hypothetical protein